MFFLCFYFVNTIFDQVEQLKGEIKISQRKVEFNLEKLRSKKKGLAYHRALAPLLTSKSLPELKKKILYSPSPKYLWKKEEKNPSFYFSALKAQLERQLSLMADTFQFSYPGLGFTRTEFTQENIQNYLNRLDLLEKILVHAMKSGIPKVEKIESEKETLTYPIPGTRYEIISLPLQISVIAPNQKLVLFLAPFNQDNPSNDLPHLELVEMKVKTVGTTGLLRAELLFYALQLRKLKEKVADETKPSHSGNNTGWGRRTLIRKMR
ncbi:MAG: hypothetical protein D6785_11720 [Planctomycetota bacterium]|nr:MAG: hypothetical protein D6785_11720 [Planctomycetota bacterium]